MTRQYLFFVPAVIWACIIFILSTNTPVEVGPVNWLDFISIDKLGHFAFYCVFCVLVCWGLFKNNLLNQESPILKLVFPIMLVIIYGIVMELLQLRFYEERHLEYMDMLANAIGALLGAFVFKRFLVSIL